MPNKEIQKKPNRFGEPPKSLRQVLMECDLENAGLSFAAGGLLVWGIMHTQGIRDEVNFKMIKESSKTPEEEVKNAINELRRKGYCRRARSSVLFAGEFVYEFNSKPIGDWFRINDLKKGF